jgi:site-specific recombinase XerD
MALYAKLSSSDVGVKELTGRVISINDELGSILTAHRAWFVEEFGEPAPDHHLFPWANRSHPIRPAMRQTSQWGWDELRKDTKVSCRLHDLRHTFATRLCENGVSESRMLALMGYMSRSMLERYSHIRDSATRDAMAGVTLFQKIQNPPVVPVEVLVVSQTARIQ